MTDWDDAYDNRGYIENSDDYPAKWSKLAAGFRKDMLASSQAELDVSYGDQERSALDFFYPASQSKGLILFVHGGYWRAFDKSFWSHLASGSLEHGWTVCIPSYTLAPEARIFEITRQVGQSIDFAADRIEGPIRLTGHSAGGHLVSRMMCPDTRLSDACRNRVERIVSISGVHDLHPLMKTQLNETLQIDDAEALAESPALHQPVGEFSLSCWVGENERPEFIRQNDLLHDSWSKARISSKRTIDPGKHHFSVVEELANPNAPLTEEIVGVR